MKLIWRLGRHNLQVCSELVTCSTIPGGYVCGECPAGFAGDGTSCVDIDECLEGNGGCSPLVDCSNTEGGSECGDCPDGYTGSGSTRCLQSSSCAQVKLQFSESNDWIRSLLLKHCLQIMIHAFFVMKHTTIALIILCSQYLKFGWGMETFWKEESCVVNGVFLSPCAQDNGGCDELTGCTDASAGPTCGECPEGYVGTGATGCLDFDACAAQPCYFDVFCEDRAAPDMGYVCSQVYGLLPSLSRGGGCSQMYALLPSLSRGGGCSQMYGLLPSPSRGCGCSR